MMGGITQCRLLWWGAVEQSFGVAAELSPGPELALLPML
jgi:hypothetical protein